MKITSSRKKFSAYIEKALMPASSGKQFHEPTVTVVRDGRVKTLDKRRKLIERTGFHNESATALFRFLKARAREGDFPFEVVAVKSEDIPAIIDSKKVHSVYGYAQRYFHRPSLASLERYLWLKQRFAKFLSSKQPFSLGAEQAIKNNLNSLDVSYCMHLLHKNPNITHSAVEKVISALNNEFYDARNNAVFDKHFDFSPTNFIVFGWAKNGKLKIGVVDL